MAANNFVCVWQNNDACLHHTEVILFCPSNRFFTFQHLLLLLFLLTYCLMGCSWKACSLVFVKLELKLIEINGSLAICSFQLPKATKPLRYTQVIRKNKRVIVHAMPAKAAGIRLRPLLSSWPFTSEIKSNTIHTWYKEISMKEAKTREVTYQRWWWNTFCDLFRSWWGSQVGHCWNVLITKLSSLLTLLHNLSLDLFTLSVNCLCLLFVLLFCDFPPKP